MFNFDQSEEKEIKDFCRLNELDYMDFIKSCFNKGYQIEKYGLLNINGQTVIEKEVVKEVPIEKIVEIEKEIIIEKPIEIIKEVIIEKPIEIIKEVIIEKPIEIIKEVMVTNNEEINILLSKISELENKPEKVVEVIRKSDNKEKQQMLQKTIQQLRDDIRKKDEKILQLEKDIIHLKEINRPIKGQFMRSSNLYDNL